MRLITWVGLIGAIALLFAGGFTIMSYVVWQKDVARIHSIPSEIIINDSNINGILTQNLTVQTSGFEMCSYHLPAISNTRVCNQICQTQGLNGTLIMNDTDRCPFWCVCKENP